MGIDIGTSGCKAVLFDNDGNLKHTAYREYNIISLNPGWAELDSAEVIKKSFEVIKESSEYAQKGKVRGIGISSQGEAFTLIDRDGNALSNAFVSSDIRADSYLKKVSEQFGDERIYNITGHTPHPMFSLFKLLWLRDNMPSIWQKAHKIFCFEDLLSYRLGVKNPAIAYSLAGRTMLFDVREHSWNKDILDLTGISESQLAIPLPSGTVAGNISKEATRLLNLSENTIIATGGHDQVCSALGAGAIEPGVAAYTSGTVECITAAFKTPIFNDELRKSNLCTYDHAFPEIYATLAFSLTGGNILKWFRDNFGQTEIAEANSLKKDPYEILLSKIQDQPTKLLVLPYFTPSGTPYFSTTVKGAILGLELSTKREEILKALLEGVTLEMKLNLDILEKAGYRVNELRIIGGGAKSMIWNQLRADICEKTISVPNVTEAGCMGAAILAKTAREGLSTLQIVNDWVKTFKQLLPGEQGIYDEKFKTYKELYQTIATIEL